MEHSVCSGTHVTQKHPTTGESKNSGAHLTGNLISEFLRYSILHNTRVTGCMYHLLQL